MFSRIIVFFCLLSTFLVYVASAANRGLRESPRSKTISFVECKFDAAAEDREGEVVEEGLSALIQYLPPDFDYSTIVESDSQLADINNDYEAAEYVCENGICRLVGKKSTDQPW